MRGLLTLLCLVIGAAAALAFRWREESIVQFSVERETQIGDKLTVEQEDKLLFKMLMGHNGQLRSGRLNTFKIQNCSDPSKGLAEVSKVMISPDPLTFPGTFYVTFAAKIKKTLQSPLQGNVLFERRVGSTWIKIPCVGMVGSCLYDDLCDLLSDAVCPEPFVTAGVPCKCPFTQGSYSLNKAAFDVGAAVFPPGDYHVQFNITMGSALVGCLEAWVSFG